MRLGIQRTGFARAAGGLSDVYWAIDWTWKGDHHRFVPAPSLGSHTNVSERARADERERKLMQEYYEQEEARWDGAA